MAGNLGWRFHQAARDCHLNLLKEASRRELNQSDEDGMTPVHWAAYSGRLEALRVIIGRGGDPDKTDLWGNTALHHAARNHHVTCVTFLVNFGANIWTLDNDLQSVLDIAALNGHQDIVRYLDTEFCRQTALNPKDAAKKKQKSIIEAEKRLKKWEKLTKESKTAVGNRDREIVPEVCKERSGSVGSGNACHHGANAEEPKGKSTVRSLEQKFKQTLRIGVNYHPTNGGESKSAGNTINKSFSQHVLQKNGKPRKSTKEILAGPQRAPSADVIYACPQEETGADSGISLDLSPEPPSLFDRPGFGSVSFRTTQMYETLHSLDASETNSTALSNSDKSKSPVSDFQESANYAWQEEEIELTDSEPDPTALDLFLESNNLSEYAHLFAQEEITLESLALLTEKGIIRKLPHRLQHHLSKFSSKKEVKAGFCSLHRDPALPVQRTTNRLLPPFSTKTWIDDVSNDDVIYG